MKKSFKELNLSNAFLFAAALQSPDTCQLVLEIIFGKKLPKVNVCAEHTVLVSSDARSIRLDIYADDELQVHYNVEAQNENEWNLPKRSRFHQAEMDVAALKPGEDFNSLKPSYVIFICTFDPFGEGLYRYTFENRCLERNIGLGDETVKIFLNTKGRNDTEVSAELIHFLKYMENSTDTFVEQVTETSIMQLHDRVKSLKKWRELEARYMTVQDWIDREAKKAAKEAAEIAAEKAAKEATEKGLAEGLKQGLTQGLAQGLKQGLTAGRAESVIELLNELGDIPSEVCEQIRSEKNAEILKDWLKLAAKVTSIEQFTKQM